MASFEAKPKHWGNSLGITIPKEIVEKERLSPHKRILITILQNDMEKVRKSFGTLKLKKPTQQVMDEIDEGYD